MKSSDKKSESRRAMTPEAREDQIIALAYDEVEKRIRNGIATSQELCHFLKLGSTKDRLEKQKLEQEVKLAAAKTEAIESSKQYDELYTKAINAMLGYSGRGDEIDEEQDQE